MESRDSVVFGSAFSAPWSLGVSVAYLAEGYKKWEYGEPQARQKPCRNMDFKAGEYPGRRAGQLVPNTYLSCKTPCLVRG